MQRIATKSSGFLSLSGSEAYAAGPSNSSGEARINSGLWSAGAGTAATNTRSSSKSRSSTAMIPVILVLFPAAVGLALGDTAGSLASDIILLGVLAYALWTLSEKTWQIYLTVWAGSKEPRASKPTTTTKAVSRRTSRESFVERPPELPSAQGNRPPSFLVALTLMLHITTPFLGGLILQLSRHNLYAGPVLMSDLNIFLYVTLEVVRMIHRVVNLTEKEFQVKASSDSIDSTSFTTAFVQNKISDVSTRIQELDNELDKIAKRVFHNESILQSEVFSIYKAFEQVNFDLRDITHRVKVVEMKDKEEPAPDDTKGRRTETSTAARPQRKPTLHQPAESSGDSGSTISGSPWSMIGETNVRLNSAKTRPVKVANGSGRDQARASSKLSKEVTSGRTNKSTPRVVQSGTASSEKHPNQKKGNILDSAVKFIIKWIVVKLLSVFSIPYESVVSLKARTKGIIKWLLAPLFRKNRKHT